MGGEKVFPSGLPAQKRGSPPRGRGKADFPRLLNFGLGITPAWAGKSINHTEIRFRTEDHPRVGGEKPLRYVVTVCRKGSPPRGRGKVITEDFTENNTGITPAWAGKRKKCIRKFYRCEDHPRVGGEKRRLTITATSISGSPPRGRGKVIDSITVMRSTRITPAWAGKRPCLPSGSSSSRDHPRVGGEKS